METYKIKFVCTNCGYIFIVDIPKGQRAEGQGGICPYCGWNDNNPNKFERVPIGETRTILLEENNVRNKKNT